MLIICGRCQTELTTDNGTFIECHICKSPRMQYYVGNSALVASAIGIIDPNDILDWNFNEKCCRYRSKWVCDTYDEYLKLWNFQMVIKLGI